MDEDIIEKAGTYADRRNRHVTGQLGSGIHGIVFVTEGNVYPGASALKLHYSEEPYRRERDAYRRLAEDGVTAIRGLRVPQMIASDDELLALEMTMVKPPFLLDFASAWLDRRPEFSEEVWEDWRRKNEEQFGADWPEVQLIFANLKDSGSTCSIHRRITSGFAEFIGSGTAGIARSRR